jgi:hypothetical protein
MLCSCCHGQHFILTRGQFLPCPECGGMGEIHCCDGLMMQPESTHTTRGDRAATPEELPHPPQQRATR